MNKVRAMVNAAYEALEGSEVVEEYHSRHAVKSLGVLTVTDDEDAERIAEYLAPEIEGRTVVEIGAGIGLLALRLGNYASRVYSFEADPMWTSVYVKFLYAHKPKNVSFIFGQAEEFAGQIKADVALFCSHSGIADMERVGRLFAPKVIDVYSNLRREMSR